MGKFDTQTTFFESNICNCKKEKIVEVFWEEVLRKCDISAICQRTLLLLGQMKLFKIVYLVANFHFEMFSLKKVIKKQTVNI